MSRPRSPRSSFVAVLLLVVAAITVVTVVAACGGRSGGSGAEFTGFWTATEPDSGWTIGVHIERQGDSFVVAVGEATGVAAELKNGKLSAGRMAFTTTGDKLVGTMSDDSGRTVETLTFAPASAEQFEAAVASFHKAVTDQAAKEGIHTLQVGVTQWAVDHHDRYPPVSEVTVDGLGPRNYVDSWPTNPYTGRPMKLGKSAGDFTYRQVDGGAGFRLVGYGEGGSVVVAVPNGQ